MINPFKLVLYRKDKWKRQWTKPSGWHVTECHSVLCIDWGLLGLLILGFLGWVSSLGFATCTVRQNGELKFELPNWFRWLEWLRGKK